MLHMNKTERYAQLYRDLKTVYDCRSTPAAHYIAGMAIGSEIWRGISDIERVNLCKIFTVARNAL